MNINIEHQDTFIERLRKVELEDANRTKVYAYSDINFITFYSHKLILPVQRYVLMPNLLHLKNLEYELNMNDSSLYDLRTSIKIDYNWEIIPPVVEEIFINGSAYFMVCDGLHRFYTAYLERRAISVVYIKRISFPYYAYPVPEDFSWKDISVLDYMPSKFFKRWYRLDHMNLRRDFNSVFNLKRRDK